MKKPICLIPVGDVMNELHQEMKAGKVPGYSSILRVYADGIHLNEVGRFIIGCTFYATIFKGDPHGLSGVPYKVADTALITTIQDAAWKVVRANALDGVARK